MKKVRVSTKIRELVYELTVDKVMVTKVVTAHEELPMTEFRRLMREKRISGVPVVDDEMRLKGIISIADLIAWLSVDNVDMPVAERMTTDVVFLRPEDLAITAVRLFEKYRVGRLPVVDAKTQEVLGIVTHHTILESILNRLEVEYHEEEIHHYRASHIFEDIIADKTRVTLEYFVADTPLEFGGEVSSSIRKTLHRLGVPEEVVRRASIAVYEAEMNLLAHADGGRMDVDVCPDSLTILVSDSGPGIPDIELAMQPGYSTAPEWVRELGFGAGMGLTNIKTCSDAFDIQSEVGVGTTLRICFNVEGICE